MLVGLGPDAAAAFDRRVGLCGVRRKRDAELRTCRCLDRLRPGRRDRAAAPAQDLVESCNAARREVLVGLGVGRVIGANSQFRLQRKLGADEEERNRQ